MCGIFSFITTSGRGPDLARLKFIAALTERRGRHAFGLAWVAADGRLHTFKRPGPATSNLDDLDRCQGASIVIGHCRHVTHGIAEDNRNNHPHRAGSGWLVHNGVVANYARLARRYRLRLSSQCDSEVLGKLVARCGGALLERAHRAVQVADGPLAILGIWRAPPRLLIVRRGKPLCFGQAAEGLYFGSLVAGLPGRVLPMTEGCLWLLSHGNRGLQLETLSRNAVGAPRSVAAGGSRRLKMAAIPSKFFHKEIRDVEEEDHCEEERYEQRREEGHKV